jgi:hypothetical protein
VSSGLLIATPRPPDQRSRRGSDPTDRAIESCDPYPRSHRFTFAAAVSPYSGRPDPQRRFGTCINDRFAPFGRRKRPDGETRTGANVTTLEEQQQHAGGARSAVGIQDPHPPRGNESQTMSQYFTAFAFLLLVMSPPLIPALVAVVHRSIRSVRSVANWRRARLAASLP